VFGGAPSAMEGGDNDELKGEEKGAPPRRLFIVKDALVGAGVHQQRGKILNFVPRAGGHNANTNECTLPSRQRCGSARASTSLRENRSTARQPGNQSTLGDASVPISDPET
jgi:hypothetical protein